MNIDESKLISFFKVACVVLNVYKCFIDFAYKGIGE